MIRRFEKYAFLAGTSARSNLAYLAEVAASGIFLFVILFIFLQLWKVTFSGTGSTTLGSLTLSQMLWYLGVTEAITFSRPRFTSEIDLEVRTGSLAVHLVRPISYPLYRLWVSMGERFVRFSLFLALAILICLLFVEDAAFSAKGLTMFVLSLPLAFLAEFLAYFLIGLGAFWLEDTSGLVLLYSRVMMLLGGTLLPLELFPDWAQPLLRWLPFSASVYGPARLWVRPETTFFGELLIHQSAVVVVLGALVFWVYRLALARIHSQGG